VPPAYIYLPMPMQIKNMIKYASNFSKIKNKEINKNKYKINDKNTNLKKSSNLAVEYFRGEGE